jgi:hypothetical protein
MKVWDASISGKDGPRPQRAMKIFPPLLQLLLALTLTEIMVEDGLAGRIH